METGKNRTTAKFNSLIANKLEHAEQTKIYGIGPGLRLIRGNKEDDQSALLKELARNSPPSDKEAKWIHSKTSVVKEAAANVRKEISSAFNESAKRIIKDIISINEGQMFFGNYEERHSRRVGSNFEETSMNPNNCTINNFNLTIKLLNFYLPEKFGELMLDTIKFNRNIGVDTTSDVADSFSKPFENRVLGKLDVIKKQSINALGMVNSIHGLDNAVTKIENSVYDIVNDIIKESANIKDKIR